MTESKGRLKKNKAAKDVLETDVEGIAIRYSRC